MIVLGLLPVAVVVAVGAAVILVVQNAGDIEVHVLGWQWHVPAHWLARAGPIIKGVADEGYPVGERPVARSPARQVGAMS